ncbi:hypothetical protein HELRODRAFT_184317, partial [Helobdella robusta]|uniref:Uncharacterized protein n=1 Tax=Helobdella robusta TaxID=6412 RepID=T1FKZ3_HELRO
MCKCVCVWIVFACGVFVLKSFIVLVLNLVALLAQISVGGLLTWNLYRAPNSDPIMYCSVVPCLFCLSLKWWENYSGDDRAPFANVHFLSNLASDIKRSRTKIQLCTSLVKIMTTFATLVLSAWLQMDKISPSGRYEWKNCKSQVYPETDITALQELNNNLVPTLGSAWIHMFLLNVASGIIVYFMSTVAAKIQIQQ